MDLSPLLNPAGGRVHGQLKMKYAIEDNNWRNSHFHNGNDSLTFVQGVMRHDALPGWYLAFSEGRTTHYNGTWEDQSYLSQNQWTQLIIGHEYFYKRLRYGWDVMGEAPQSRTAGKAALSSLPIFGLRTISHSLTICISRSITAAAVDRKMTATCVHFRLSLACNILLITPPASGSASNLPLPF